MIAPSQVDAYQIPSTPTERFPEKNGCLTVYRNTFEFLGEMYNANFSILIIIIARFSPTISR